ncbi:helicase HerA-like domain-containing protein [Thermogladius sp. KZ2Tp1]|uniref:ATP-binding protein n=1 Tax=Thermogladius sp. KZ2Tp1 TaxID=3136289 RepID=UPI003DA9702A
MVRLRGIRGLFNRQSNNQEVRVDPPDVYLVSRDKVVGFRYIVADEMDFDVRGLSPSRLYDNVERLASVIDKLPHGSEVKLVKTQLDLSSYARKIENEMANLRASLELTSEPHIKARLETRLETLSELYRLIVEGRPLLRLSFVVKIRVEAKSVEEARQILSYHSSMVSNILRSSLGLKVREAKREVEKILAYEAGLSSELGIRTFVGPMSAAAPVLPIPAVKRPKLDYDNAVVLGVEIEENTPVLVPTELLTKHMLVIGPTGRGKTTLLANLLQVFASLGTGIFLGVDFKGDLASYLEGGIAKVVEPREYPLSIRSLVSGGLEVKSLITDILSSSLQVPRDSLVESVEYVYSLLTDDHLEGGVRADVLPLMELLRGDASTSNLRELILGDNVLVNLGGYGYAYQTAYGLSLLYLAKDAIFKRSTSEPRLLVVDEAWRVSRSRLVVELFKEGRSRRVGVVLSTQNPGDIPREVFENAHLLVVFGSPNEKYARTVAELLGLEYDALFKKLGRLGVGEAVLLNTLDPHPVVFKVRNPVKKNSGDERRAS